MAPEQAPKPNYSLYLVTDVTEPILGKRDLVTQVRNAIAGGVSIVQHRDKNSSTATLIRDSKALHSVTKQYGIPLLINDRVDVALAINAEGVHLGQDDMPLQTARKLLGPSKIIGISVSTPTEASEAIKGGANYVGIGTMFGTSTKKDTKEIIGTSGTQGILAAIAEAERAADRRIGTVAIGGINASNVQRVLYQSSSQNPPRALDGVAVVSALMASDDPKTAAGQLRRLVATYEEETPFATLVYPPEVPTADLVEAYLGRDIPALITRVREKKPLCHNMTNLVVQNFAANVALAVGGSPIMATDGAEALDLAKLGGSLVINMGSASANAVEQASIALKAYNAVGGPVLFDPVGAGATQVRKKAIRDLLAAGYFDVIKGNESEIASVAAAVDAAGKGSSSADGTQHPQQHGVDSADSGLTLRQKAELVRSLAERRRCIVVMTGKEDLVSDGVRVLSIGNGHPILSRVTGTGCTLGTTIAAMLAVEKQDKLQAVIAGLLLFEIAAEQAIDAVTTAEKAVKLAMAYKAGVDGSAVDVAPLSAYSPGSFIPAFLDTLYRNSSPFSVRAAAGERGGWLEKAKVAPVETMTNGDAGR